MLYIQTFFIPTGPPDIALHKNKISVDIQIIFELNFRKEKWLVLSVYKPPAQNAIYFLNSCVLSSLFLYPLKTSENRNVFRGQRNGALRTNGFTGYLKLLTFTVLHAKL